MKEIKYDEQVAGDFLFLMVTDLPKCSNREITILQQHRPPRLQKLDWAQLAGSLFCFFLSDKVKSQMLMIHLWVFSYSESKNHRLLCLYLTASDILWWMRFFFFFLQVNFDLVPTAGRSKNYELTDCLSEFCSDHRAHMEVSVCQGTCEHLSVDEWLQPVSWEEPVLLV